MTPAVIEGGTQAMRLVQFLALSGCFTNNIISSSDSLTVLVRSMWNLFSSYLNCDLAVTIITLLM